MTTVSLPASSGCPSERPPWPPSGQLELLVDTRCRSRARQTPPSGRSFRRFERRRSASWSPSTGRRAPSTQSPRAGLSASLNVLQTFTTEAEVANGTNAIDVRIRPRHHRRDGCHAEPASHSDLPRWPTVLSARQRATAQINADLQLTGPLLGGTLDIPVTGAQGTATLQRESPVLNRTTRSDRRASRPAATTATAAVTLGGTSLGTLTLSGAASTSLPFGASRCAPHGTRPSPTTPTRRASRPRRRPFPSAGPASRGWRPPC